MSALVHKVHLNKKRKESNTMWYNFFPMSYNNKMCFFCFLYVKCTISSLSPDKRLSSKEERRRADPAYEIMESRMLERNPEVDTSKTL